VYEDLDEAPVEEIVSYGGMRVQEVREVLVVPSLLVVVVILGCRAMMSPLPECMGCFLPFFLCF